MRKIYCIGETVYDIIFKNGLPKAAKAGGSMLNSTISLGRMNLPVYFISEYGTDDLGKEIENFLSANNVNTQYIYRYNKGKTSIALAFLNEQNDAHYSFYKDLPEKRMDIDFPEPKSNDILLFGSFYSINKEVRNYVKTLVSKAKEAGAIIIYDPNFRKAHLNELSELLPLIIENIELATIVRGSDEDFKMIFNSKSAEETYKEISKYCRNLIYTASTKGVFLLNESHNFKMQVPKLKPISTIGAGDNFNAGLIYGLIKENILYNDITVLKKNHWHKILKCGIDFASEVCLSYDNYISAKYAKKCKEL